MRIGRTLTLTAAAALAVITLGAAGGGCIGGANDMPVTKTQGGRIGACVNSPIVIVQSKGCSGPPVNPPGNSGGGTGGLGCHPNSFGVEVDNQGNTNDCPQNSSSGGGSSGSSGSGGSSSGSADNGTACPPGSLGAGTNNC